jgi:hypothetical protein
MAFRDCAPICAPTASAQPTRLTSPHTPRTPPTAIVRRKCAPICAPNTGNKATQEDHQTASKLGKHSQPRPESTRPMRQCSAYKAVSAPPAALSPGWAQLVSNQRPLACKDCHQHTPDLRLGLSAQVRIEQERAPPSSGEQSALPFALPFALPLRDCSYGSEWVAWPSREAESSDASVQPTSRRSVT